MKMHLYEFVDFYVRAHVYEQAHVNVCVLLFMSTYMYTCFYMYMYMSRDICMRTCVDV